MFYGNNDGNNSQTSLQHDAFNRQKKSETCRAYPKVIIKIFLILPFLLF